MSCLLIYGAVLLAQREILPVGRINILLTRLIRRALRVWQFTCLINASNALSSFQILVFQAPIFLSNDLSTV